MIENLKFLIHNTVAHPLAGWLWFFGLESLGDLAHAVYAPPSPDQNIHVDVSIDGEEVARAAKQSAEALAKMFENIGPLIRDGGVIDEIMNRSEREVVAEMNRDADRQSWRAFEDQVYRMFGDGS